MGGSVTFDFTVALVVARFQSCPADKVCSLLESLHVPSGFRNQGRGRAFLYRRYCLQAFELLGEVLLAHGGKCFLAFLDMTLNHFDYLLIMAYQKDVRFMEFPSECSLDCLATMFVDSSCVNQPHQFLWVCGSFRNGAYAVLVAFALDVGDIIAQSETAPLQRRVELVGVVGEVFL